MVFPANIYVYIVNTKQCRQLHQRIYRQGVIAGGIAFELTKQR